MQKVMNCEGRRVCDMFTVVWSQSHSWANQSNVKNIGRQHVSTQLVWILIRIVNTTNVLHPAVKLEPGIELKESHEASHLAA